MNVVISHGISSVLPANLTSFANNVANFLQNVMNAKFGQRSSHFLILNACHSAQILHSMAIVFATIKGKKLYIPVGSLI